MKHITWRVLSLTLLALSAPALTSHDEGNAWQSNIGLNFNFARYRFGCLPRLDGYLAGLHWDISHSMPSKWYVNLQFDGNWNAGPVCSDCNNNCDCDNTPPLGCADIKTSIKDFRPEFDFGYNFTFCENENFALTPFIGFGFYYLSNKLRPQDVTYRYYNVNVPIGLSMLWTLDRNCLSDIGLSITYRIDAWTRLKMTIADIDMSLITCENACDNDCNKDCNSCVPNNVVVVKCDDPCDNSCNKIKLERSNGVHVAMPMRWNFDMEDRCMNMQAKVVPFFDWNSFGSAKECNENSLELPIPRLKQWYLGLHVDVGINF